MAAPVVSRPDALSRPDVVSRAEAEQLAELFRLLGDPSRARILYALVDAGECCVGDLATMVEASETSVSQALRLLRTAGVVRHRREGRHVHYRLDDDHVRRLLELSREHLRHGPPDRVGDRSTDRADGRPTSGADGRPTDGAAGHG